MKLKIVGLRPGEKLHEILCPADSSHLTIEFKKYFIIKPEIVFFNEKINYMKNIDGEKGKIIKKRFEYNSINNSEFLTIKQIKSKLD
jgi:UDP-N-acetylglucosamine 4,6-dehydratase